MASRGRPGTRYICVWNVGVYNTRKPELQLAAARATSGTGAVLTLDGGPMDAHYFGTPGLLA